MSNQVRQTEVSGVTHCSVSENESDMSKILTMLLNAMKRRNYCKIKSHGILVNPAG